MTVRRFAAGDLEAVLALWRAARFAGGRSPQEDRAYLLALQDVWVAEREGAVVGFVALSPGWVEQLHVTPDAQRTGVGSELLRFACSRMDELRLHTHQANAVARAFYARHGFEELALGVSPAPECLPDVLLRWSSAPSAPG